MKELIEKSASRLALEYLPTAIAEEIERLALGRRCGLSGLREIRLRRDGFCRVLLGEENIRLSTGLSAEDMELIMTSLTSGAMYACRDRIAEGYISLERGIRVGICGRAAYDGGRLSGIDGVSSLLFRIPTGRCEFAEELYSVYSEGIGRGMLIYSPPGVGKTTAIRTLAAKIGYGREGLAVAVIDERGEFDRLDFVGCSVDILKGYKKARGIEIATRTLSPEIIIIDELSSEDTEALINSLNCGIPIIATVHAADREELFQKKYLKELFDRSVFSLTLGILRRGGKYILSAEKI